LSVILLKISTLIDYPGPYQWHTHAHDINSQVYLTGLYGHISYETGWGPMHRNRAADNTLPCVR